MDKMTGRRRRRREIYGQLGNSSAEQEDFISSVDIKEEEEYIIRPEFDRYTLHKNTQDINDTRVIGSEELLSQSLLKQLIESRRKSQNAEDRRRNYETNIASSLLSEATDGRPTDKQTGNVRHNLQLNKVEISSTKMKSNDSNNGAKNGTDDDPYRGTVVYHGTASNVLKDSALDPMHKISVDDLIQDSNYHYSSVIDSDSHNKKVDGVLKVAHKLQVLSPEDVQNLRKIKQDNSVVRESKKYSIYCQ